MSLAADALQSGSPAVADLAFARAILDESGVDVGLCYQCGRCAAGCPVSYAMDASPSQLIHAIQLGLDDFVLGSRTIWLCASCETCTTRCPQEVDVSRVMDAAKIVAVRRKERPAVGGVRAFHRSALASIRRFGRLWEAGTIAWLKLRTRDLLKDLELGRRMLRKGKLKLLPSFTGSRRAARIFARVRRLERSGNGRS